MSSLVSVLKYVRSNGLLGTMAAGLRFAKDVRQAWREADFDRRYGTDTGGVVDDMERLGVSKERAAHAFGYEAIQLDVFARIMIKAERERAAARAAFESPFAEITDDDIDSLFSD